MASFSITFPLNKSCLLCVFLVFICSFSFSHAREHTKINNHFIDVHVGSLFPQKEVICTHSSRGVKKEGISMEVMHRHGPCSKIKSDETEHVTQSHSEHLKVDQDRVDSIHARISGQSLAGEEVALKRNSVNLPAQSGASIGTGNYIVSVGLGTPQKTLSFIFDTGSDLTWTQCKPCLKSCYDQVDPMFEPSASSSYANVSCTSSACAELMSATGVKPGCTSSSACIYGIQYGDQSFSVGYFAQERISLSSADYIDGYLFGCGENNQGLFKGAAGLIGLGRNPLSLVSQAANKYGKCFSYCLPLDSSSTGHLTLGRGGTSAPKFSYTPLLSGTGGSANDLYFINLQSISIGGRLIPVSPAVFSAVGTIIDSGTVITRLPPKAYSVLSSTFKSYMTKYPSAPALSILDTCYNFSSYETVLVPKVVLYFGGGGVLNLPAANTLLAVSSSQVCLAFAGNSGDTDVSIVGNVQQQGFDVVYDVDGGKIGFGPNGC